MLLLCCRIEDRDLGLCYCYAAGLKGGLFEGVLNANAFGGELLVSCLISLLHPWFPSWAFIILVSY